MSSLGEALSSLLPVSGDARPGSALIDASMAAAALVATAEGDVSFAERATLDQAIDALAARGEADPQLAAEIFEEFVEAIRANSSQGSRPALAAIGAVEGAAEAAAVVLRIAQAVGHADGHISQPELEAIERVAEALTAAWD